MPSNDEVVWGIPTIQCPSCQTPLDVSGAKIQKLSKSQLSAESRNFEMRSVVETKTATLEDMARYEPENTFVVVTCPVLTCSQYSKVKVLRIPRIHTPSIKLDLA